MKAGLAAAVAAGRHHRSGVRVAGDVIVAAVMHHDTNGVGTKVLMQTLEAPVHHGIVAHLSLQLVHSGACQFGLIVRGRLADFSRRDQGIDAIRKMTRILDGLLDETFRGGGRAPSSRTCRAWSSVVS